MRVAVSSRPCGTSPGTSSAPAVSPARCWAGRSQELYGGEGYASPGQAAGAARPVGNLLDLGGDLLEGREIDGDFGHLDVTAQGAWSAGANGSTDPFGNMSGTIGLRGGMELGADA